MTVHELETALEGFGRRVAGHRRALLVALGSALVLVGTVLLIGKVARFARMLDTLRGADAVWFPILLGGLVVAFAGYVMCYRGTARVFDGPRLGVWLTMRAVATSLGAVVVATGAGGLAVDYWVLRRAGESRHMAFARVLALNTLEWAVLGAAATGAAAAELAGAGPGVPYGLALGWLVTVPLCFLAAAWVSSPKRIDRFATPEVGGRIRRLLADAIRGVAIVRAVLAHPARHWEAFFGAVLYWGGLAGCLWGGLRAFGVTLGIIPLVLAFATGYVATMLPLPLGGVGGVDAAMTYALTAVGVPLAPALLGVVAYRFFTFWVPIVPGALAGATVMQTRADLPSASRSAGQP